MRTTEFIEVFESGEYCVTITDGLDCESIDCRYIEVDTTIFEDCFSFIYSNFETDSVETLMVETWGVAPFTYVWTFGDSIVSTSATHVPEETGVYCVMVTDAEGCVSEACYDYFVWEECGVWISCDPLEPGLVQLWAFGYGAEPLEYVWNTGDTGEELIVTESGEYCVTITDAEGCTSSTCIEVNLEDVAECFAPIEVIEYEDYAELTINPITDGQYEFIWSTGETTPSITVEESGTYCVEVIEIETGCSFVTCATVYFFEDECWAYIETEYESDTSAFLTVYAYNFESDTLDFEYVWSTGETTQTIVATEEGTYCVTITSATGCVFETCEDVIFWDIPWSNSIFGMIYDLEADFPIDGVIDLYQVLDNGTLELYAEGIETVDGGFFAIEEVDDGAYIILATADGEGYVPTYAHSTTSWEEADIFELGPNNPIVAVDIAVIPVSGVDGVGTIEGTVSTDNLVANGKDDENRSGSPLENANIILLHSDIHVGQIFTNSDGEFKFENLPFGTYHVVLEVPGQERKIIEVILSQENPNAGGIEFETEDTSTSTENLPALSSLTLSPNPTSGNLTIDTYFEDVKQVTYSIIDMNGKIVRSSTFVSIIGENSLQLDVTSFQNGVYNIVLQSEEGLTSKRFIKL